MPEKNWPNPKKEGFPLFPDHAGGHLLRDKSTSDEIFGDWNGADEEWNIRGGWLSAQDTAEKYDYISCECVSLSPLSLEEILAAERERCAVIADAKHDAVWNGKIGSLEKDKLRTGYAQAAITIGEAIRNLGAAS